MNVFESVFESIVVSIVVNVVVKNKVRKRFIAGAVCPKCKAQDTMSLTKENGVEKVTCVSCGEQMTQSEPQVAEVVRQHEQVIGVFKQ
ncbi:MAG: YheV family putative metal-binding protein [Colwellia sp.]|nr:YheV family putative metal-binding protein [Colwellia sp.]